MDVSTNLFPRGVFDLVNYHLVMQRLALKHSVQFPPDNEQGKKTGVGAKVRALVLARLRANEPVIHRWQEVRLYFTHVKDHFTYDNRLSRSWLSLRMFLLHLLS